MPRGLGSLDISSTTIKPILNTTEPRSTLRSLYYYARQLTASGPKPLHSTLRGSLESLKLIL